MNTIEHSTARVERFSLTKPSIENLGLRLISRSTAFSYTHQHAVFHTFNDSELNLNTTLHITNSSHQSTVTHYFVTHPVNSIIFGFFYWKSKWALHLNDMARDNVNRQERRQRLRCSKNGAKKDFFFLVQKEKNLRWIFGFSNEDEMFKELLFIVFIQR